MATLDFNYNMTIGFSMPVIKHCYTLRCIPLECENQHIEDIKVKVFPENELTYSADGFGNILVTDRIVTMHNEFTVDVEGTVITGEHVTPDSEPNPVYKYPTHFTACGTELQKMFDRIRVGISDDAVDTALKFTRAIRANIVYKSGATSVITTAEEALLNGAGVCQDYSHILLALLRKAGIPARYVVGMMVGEGETHAWVEVYHNGCWYGVDPTNNRLADENYIIISRGRDFADCGINRGLLTGGGTQKQTVSLKAVKRQSASY